MKKFIITTVSVLLIFFAGGETTFAQGFINSNTFNTHQELNSSGPDSSHQKFAEQSIKILENDKGEEAAQIFNGYETLLLEYCDKPDSDEKGYAFAYHFYNPYTKENYLPSMVKASKTTAMTKFKSHINNAVSLYPTSKEESIKELGRAIHFLEDVNVPHHAANLIAVLSSHTQYENYIDEDEDKFFVNTSNAYEKNSDESFDEYCTNLFDECAKNAYSYKAVGKSYKEEEWDKAAYPTLKLAQENIASLLYRFEKEVKHN